MHRAVQTLAEGRCVAFPTETDYVVAASGRDPPRRSPGSPRSRLRVQASRCSPLALKSADEALDWAPRLSPIGRRLARRCWPGPVAMIVRRRPRGEPRASTARSGPAGDRRRRAAAAADPGHPMLADCMRMLAGPVVLAEPGGPDGSPPVTAEDVIAGGRAARSRW